LEYMVFDLLKASYVKKNEDKSSKLWRMRCFLLYPIEHMWLKKLCICLITDEYYLNCCMKLVLVTTIVAFGKINISDLLG
jgi:hypothetical protein